MNDVLVPENEVEALLRSPSTVVVDPSSRARHLAMLADLMADENASAATVPSRPVVDVDWSDAAAAVAPVGIDRAPSRRRRRTAVALVAAGALVVVGGGLAVAGLTRTPPTQPDEVRCFGVVTSEYDDEYLYVGVLRADPVGPDDGTTADVAIEQCGLLWARGTLTGVDPWVDFTVPPDAPPVNPVPPLVACVLPGGGVGVYPGEPGTCEALGFPEADLG